MRLGRKKIRLEAWQGENKQRGFVWSKAEWRLGQENSVREALPGEIIRVTWPAKKQGFLARGKEAGRLG